MSGENLEYYQKWQGYIPIVGYFWLVWQGQKHKHPVAGRGLAVRLALLLVGLALPFTNTRFAITNPFGFFLVWFIIISVLALVSPTIVNGVSRYEIQKARAKSGAVFRAGNFKVLGELGLNPDFLYVINYHELNLLTSGMFVSVLVLLFWVGIL